jgi:hypothetical protein
MTRRRNPFRSLNGERATTLLRSINRAFGEDNLAARQSLLDCASRTVEEHIRAVMWRAQRR